MLGVAAARRRAGLRDSRRAIFSSCAAATRGRSRRCSSTTASICCRSRRSRRGCCTCVQRPPTRRATRAKRSRSAASTRAARSTRATRVLPRRSIAADRRTAPGRRPVARSRRCARWRSRCRRARRYEEAAVAGGDSPSARLPAPLVREATEALAIHHEHRVRDLEPARCVCATRWRTRPRVLTHVGTGWHGLSEDRAPDMKVDGSLVDVEMVRVPEQSAATASADRSLELLSGAAAAFLPSWPPWRPSRRSCGSRRLRAELLGEPLDAAFGVEQLLLAGEERVAARADFQVQLGLGRPGLPRRAARAARLDVVVLGVNAFLHSELLGVPGKPSL